MSRDVSEPIDRAPTNLRVTRFQLRGKVTRRVREGLEPPQDSILDQGLSQEDDSTARAIPFNSRDAYLIVKKQLRLPPFISHRETACRRIASPTGDGRRISSTSTFRPSVSSKSKMSSLKSNNVRSRSRSTRKSTSLSGPASPRATE